MIDDPSTAAAAAAAGVICFPQKMRNFLRPYTPKRFAATHNQRLADRRFMDCRVIRGNDAIRVRRAGPDISKFMCPRKTVRNVAISAMKERERFPRILARCFPEPLRRSKSRRYSYDLYNRKAMSKSISHTSFYRLAASKFIERERNSCR